MNNDEIDEVIENALSQFLMGIKLNWRHQWKVMILSLIKL